MYDDITDDSYSSLIAIFIRLYNLDFMIKNKRKKKDVLMSSVRKKIMYQLKISLETEIKVRIQIKIQKRLK